jgi:integrase
MRTRHLALRTEQAYLHWLRRYVAFHHRRHPRKLGAPEVEQFLTHLAIRRKVSAATQNQALQALLFLYRHVLGIELPWLGKVTRASHPKRLPVVLSRAEVRSLLSHLHGTQWLLASLLYGSGLRLMEGLRLRVKDLQLERGELIVREAKGGKDPTPTCLPMGPKACAVRSIEGTCPRQFSLVKVRAPEQLSRQSRSDAMPRR